MNFELYSNEEKMVKECNKIMAPIELSGREKKKKTIELFHLLTCFDLLGIKYNKIIPNEPGDFIVEYDDKEAMFEVTTCFGSERENIIMKEKINKVFEFTQSEEEYIKFDLENMKSKFLKQLTVKQEKEYKHKNKILLIVTSEHDNCAITGRWYLKFLTLNDVNIGDAFNEIFVLDYFSSGIDNGPTVSKSLEEDFLEYKKYFGN